MIKRILAGIGFAAIIAAFAMQALAIELPSDRKAAKKIQLQKVPYMLVVGDRESQEGTVSVRNRKHGDQGVKPVDQFLAEVRDLIENKVPTE